MKLYNAKETPVSETLFSRTYLLPGNIDVCRLGIFQRLLLMTDGTVTKMLEAYTGEEIQVVRLSQAVHSSVLDRKILLRGRSSQRNLLYAESIIALDRLNQPVRDGLLKDEMPIGQLLLNSQAETFRKILHVSKEPAGTLADYFQVCPSLGMISRTYHIVMGQRPVMRITEKFPETHFLDMEACNTEGY